MLQVMRRNDIATWTRRFIEALEESQRDQSAGQAPRESLTESRVRIVRSGLHGYRA
jgi:hypothetical protein